MDSLARHLSRSTSSQCFRGCACDDCMLLTVAEDAASTGGASTSTSGTNSPRCSSSSSSSSANRSTTAAPTDVPYLQSLQSRLRQRLRLCWSPDRRAAEPETEEMPATPPAIRVGHKRSQEELDRSPSASAVSPALNYSFHREIFGNGIDRNSHRRGMEEHCAARMPSILKEKEVPASELKAYDKAFATTWASEDTVLVGTKCNRLLEMNIRTGHKYEVPIDIRKSNPEVAPSRAVDSSKCGIHSMAINPTGEYIATGGADPRHAVILKMPTDVGATVEAPKEGEKPKSRYEHVQTMAGHSDWVFGMAWITEKHLATCSKDHSVALWSVDAEDERGTQHTTKTAVKTITDHKAKVRDMSFCYRTKMLSTVGADATVRLWDANLQPVRTVKLDYNDELVCLAQSEDLVAVGSQNHIMIVDARDRSSSARNIKTLEHNQSIRSLTFQHQLLTVGSGFGKISFYDLRAGRFMEWGEEKKQVLEMGSGWLCPNSIFRDHFFLTPVQPACYAHAWDASGARLFTCGGPLAFGLVGCYMGVWQ